MRLNVHSLRVPALVLLAALVALPAFAADKKFMDDDASKEKDEPTTWLKNYDQLVKGKEADWVFFDGYSAAQLQDGGRQGLFLQREGQGSAARRGGRQGLRRTVDPEVASSAGRPPAERPT